MKFLTAKRVGKLHKSRNIAIRGWHTGQKTEVPVYIACIHVTENDAPISANNDKSFIHFNITIVLLKFRHLNHKTIATLLLRYYPIRIICTI